MGCSAIATVDFERLHELGLFMARSRSLAELCRLALDALVRALPERGVHVQVWSGMAPHGSWSASGGPEMSPELAREPLLSGADRLGEIVVDARDRRGCGLEEHERAWMTAIGQLLASFASRELEHETLQAERKALASLLEQLAAEEDELEILRSARARRMRAALESPRS